MASVFFLFNFTALTWGFRQPWRDPNCGVTSRGCAQSQGNILTPSFTNAHRKAERALFHVSKLLNLHYPFPSERFISGSACETVSLINESRSQTRWSADKEKPICNISLSRALTARRRNRKRNKIPRAVPGSLVEICMQIKIYNSDNAFLLKRRPFQ